MRKIREQYWYEKMKQNEEGASEVVGYILTLGIVISALGIIIVVATPIAEQARDTAKFNNMLVGFSVLKTDLDTVALTTTPIKTSKLNIAGGNLYVDPLGNVTKNRIVINIAGTERYNSTLGVIVYSYKDKQIVYENGGVIESYLGTNSILFRESPKIYVDRTIESVNNTLISIVKITGNFSSTSGEGVAYAIITLPRYNETYSSGSSEVAYLNITINSTYAKAWKKYLSDQGFAIISFNDREVVAQITQTKVIIGEHPIAVKVR